jgi:hypothetical protein
MKDTESELLYRFKDGDINWHKVDTYKPIVEDNLDSLYLAVDRADKLWGKTKLSLDFRKLLDVRGLSIYDYAIEDHYTGSAIVMNEQTEKILMTFHPWYKMWLQLGGHDDGAKDPIAVSAKEAVEESGLDDLWICDWPLSVDPHPAYACKAAKNSKNNHHYDICYLVLTDTTDFIISNESLDMRWFSINELEQFVVDNKAQQRALDAAINAIALYHALKKLNGLPLIAKTQSTDMLYNKSV